MPLLVRVGPAVEVLAQLHAELSWTHLFSHEETGPGWSYVRDRAVAAWCGSRALRWREFAQTGVVRRLRSRSGWATGWQARMDTPQLPVVGRLQPAASLDQPPLPTLSRRRLRMRRNTPSRVATVAAGGAERARRRRPPRAPAGCSPC